MPKVNHLTKQISLPICIFALVFFFATIYRDQGLISTVGLILPLPMLTLVLHLVVTINFITNLDFK